MNDETPGPDDPDDTPEPGDDEAAPGGPDDGALPEKLGAGGRRYRKGRQHRPAEMRFDDYGPMAETGRPTKCVPPTVERIAYALMKGTSWAGACAHGDIDPRAGYDWVDRARHEIAARDAGEPADPYEERFVQFYMAVVRARSSAELRAVESISDAMLEDWRAAAWWLERTRVRQFGRRQVSVMVSDDADELDGFRETAESPMALLMGRLEQTEQRLRGGVETVDVVEAVDDDEGDGRDA